MKTFARWALLTVAVFSGGVFVLSLLSDEPWTAGDMIGTVIYGLVCVGGVVTFLKLR